MIIQVVNAYALTAGGGAGFTGTLTVPTGAVAANLTDFPVYVDLSDLPAGFWSAVTSDGGNIRVSQSATDLPVDVVLIDTGTDTGYIFFKDSLLSGSDNVYTIEARSGATMAAVTDPDGRNAVWSAYHRVIMVGADRTATAVDRCGSGTTVTDYSTPDYAGAGNTIDFDGTDDGIRVAVSTFTDWTMGATATFDGHPSTNSVVLSLSPSETGTANRVTIVYRGSAQQIGVWNATDSWLTGGVTFTTGTKRCDVAYDSGGNRIVYVDGASVVSAGSSTTKPSGSTHYLYAARPNESADEELDGRLSFIYFAGSILTADWIDAQWESWKAGTAFYAIT